MSFVNIASTSIIPLELLRRSLLSSPSSTLGAQRQQLSKTSGRIASFLCKCFQRQNRAKKRDPRTISCSVRCNPILDFVGSLIFLSNSAVPTSPNVGMQTVTGGLYICDEVAECAAESISSTCETANVACSDRSPFQISYC